MALKFTHQYFRNVKKSIFYSFKTLKVSWCNILLALNYI